MSLYPWILLGTALALAIAVWAVMDIALGVQQTRELASRSALHEVERRSSSPLVRFDRWIRRTEVGRKLGDLILRAGVDIKVSTLVLVFTVTTILSIVIVWHVIAPIFGIAASGVVAYLMFSYLKHQEDRRKEEFTAQLPEVARVLSNATSAGLALPTAVDMAAEELDAPAGPELRRVADSLKLGQSFDAAMSDLRQRMPSREISVLISTLIISSRSGGALVTALRNISQTLEQRKETRREVKTILGETTSTAWVLTGLSIGSIFLVNFMFPGAIENMTESTVGLIILGVACTMLAIGVIAIRRVTRLDF